MNQKKSLPTYFISHGGGPWPWMPQLRDYFKPLEFALKAMVRDHGAKPKAILMVSGHWEEDEVAVMASKTPPMIYDYSGFPPHTYGIQYPAPGAPEFAKRTLELLKQANISAHLDFKRGFDHGLYAPMEVMYPKADVPIFQLSMLKSYDPEKHIAIGRALKPLRDEGVMIIGSGLSFHNLRLFRGNGAEPSAQFDAWLYDTMMQDAKTRLDLMLDWEKAPAARICHEAEDHLIPIFVALGAAEDENATRIFHDVGKQNGITVSNYRFG
tara:strand:+ start:2105 stop:2908 length:804 start_codon:yes stop_codon:yes gene_type:complete